MSAVCPICGYDQGEERILVSHLVGVHGGIPHVPGEELFVCQYHPAVQPMNHLEFVKHKQEVSSNVGYGQPKPPPCQPIGVSKGQVVSMPLKEWQAMAAEESRRIKTLDPRTIGAVISAVFLIGLAIFNFATYTSVASYQSTFSLQPGYAYDFRIALNPSDTVSGAFQESSGNPVSLYVLSSAQFASYQAKNPFSYLYSVTEVVSGSYSYTVDTQDTYTLFFSHGAGLINDTETVFAVRSYTTHITYRLFLGFFFLAAALADFYLAHRYNKRTSSAYTTAPITPNSPISPA